jgi:hypothetical protein
MDVRPTKTDDIVLRTDAMDVFFAWEKLRVIYNLILAAIVVGFALWIGKATFPIFYLLAALAALPANLCFCAGPTLEGYFCWMGFERRASRWFLFVCGTLLAVVLALAALEEIGKYSRELLPDR